MSSSSSESWLGDGPIEVLLDGRPISIAPERGSLSGIFSLLDTLALERQRVLYWFTVDGRPAQPGDLLSLEGPHTRVEASSLDLQQFPLHLIHTAIHQTAHAIEEVQSAISTVLINDTDTARELWWRLAVRLKCPLLTLSLLPPARSQSQNNRPSLAELRKWQLQQLASIIKDVDDICWAEDTRPLSNLLEQRVLPWLETLGDSLELWLETMQTGAAVSHPD